MNVYRWPLSPHYTWNHVDWAIICKLMPIRKSPIQNSNNDILWSMVDRPSNLPLWIRSDAMEFLIVAWMISRWVDWDDADVSSWQWRPRGRYGVLARCGTVCSRRSPSSRSSPKLCIPIHIAWDQCCYRSAFLSNATVMKYGWGTGLMVTRIIDHYRREVCGYCLWLWWTQREWKTRPRDGP